jgi:hypothetical protein
MNHISSSVSATFICLDKYFIAPLKDGEIRMSVLVLKHAYTNLHIGYHLSTN